MDLMSGRQTLPRFGLFFVLLDPAQARARMLGAGFEPGENLEAAVVMFYQRRAAFHPVAAVHVADAEIVVNAGVVGMAADHAVDLAAVCLLGQCPLEGAGIIDLVLRPLRERPMG
jgi:hypothetical protein